MKNDENDDEIDGKIEKQNKDYYKLRDKLEGQTKRSIWMSILEANHQSIPEGNSEVNILFSKLSSPWSNTSIS